MKHVDDCIWSLESGKQGTHLMILGGVHGNEQSGIMVVRELLEKFDRSPDLLTAGTLTLAFGNPAAILRGMRGSEAHCDLNRAFVPARLADASSYEHRRAAQLASYINRADVLLDLHAANKPSDPFLITTALTDRHKQLARAFACERFVVLSHSVIEGTADNYINARGGVGLSYESGLASDVSNIAEVRDATNFVLSMEGMVSGPLPPPRVPKQIFALNDALHLTEAGFRFADGRGLRSFEPMRAGDIIGYASDTPVTAPYDGVLMFPKVPELWKVRSPLVFFAEVKGLLPA